MPRYRLTIAYDGSGFCGWQKQEPLAAAPAEEPGGTAAEAGATESVTQRAYSDATPRIDSIREGRVALRTVQGVLEQAIRSVVREPVELLGASRTDSGVHARGQVAAFSCEPREAGPAMGEGKTEQADGSTTRPVMRGIGWPLERGTDRLLAAINSRLPDDVLVIDAAVANNNFDPIGDVVSKGYSYGFHVSPHRPLWDRRYVHHVWHPAGLDVEKMNRAAALLVGEHDFAAFAAAGHGRLTTVRTIFDCRVEERSPAEVEVFGAVGGEPARTPAHRRVVLHISGNGFLWNMVRIIGGTLMQVGIGQRTVEDVRSVLEGRDRTRAGPTLPPTGLCLDWIRYRQ